MNLRRLNPTSIRGAAAAVWYVAALLGVVLITAAIGGLQGRLDPVSLRMAYLLLILALAVGGGTGPAVVASIVAFLASDWFFTSPVGTFNVGNPNEWLALGLFLAVGITTGSLAAALKKSAAQSRARTEEATTLYELGTALLAGPQLGPVLSLVVERLTSVLGLAGASIALNGTNGVLEPAASAGDVPEQSLAKQPGEEAATPASVAVPVLLNGRTLGLLCAYAGPQGSGFSQRDRRLIDAFAAQAALAIGRLRLLDEQKRASAAEESDRLKSVFLASISHDLRTPITAIKTAAASLLAGPDAATALEATETIDAEADRLSRLVGDLLDISRLEAGATPLRLAPEDISDLVGASAHHLAGRLDGRTLHLAANSDLPLVLVDAPQIGRVFMNLIENAVKFSPPSAEIHVDVSSGDSTVLVQVLNAGEPIPEAEQLRVFDKFYRIERRDSAVRGTGLGLAICRAIVEAHRGRIWTANVDGGVVFSVELPVPTEAGTLAVGAPA